MMPVNNYEYSGTQASRTRNAPYAEIIEQPSSTMRFRYKTESEHAGCIVGEKTNFERKTYPMIQVHGYKGPLAIVVSCVTDDVIPRPHPHSITNRNPKHSERRNKKQHEDKGEEPSGICYLKVNLQEKVVAFSHLRVHCVKKNGVVRALEKRKQENVDPFGAGFEHINHPGSVDLSCVRLCFQIFIQSSEKKFVALKPVVSNPIFDKKAKEELLICKLSACSAPVSGGKEVILLCGKVNKDDIEVRFFEMRNNWLFWEGFGEFEPIHVHKQVAIVFRTPTYIYQDIPEPVTVYIQLRNKSNGAVSEPLPFLMLPSEFGDVNLMKRKRMRYENDPGLYLMRQMQTQARNEDAALNQSLLLNFPNQEMGHRGQPLPKPFQQHFPNPAHENKNNFPTERANFNVHYQEKQEFCSASRSQYPVARPRTSAINESVQSNVPEVPSSRLNTVPRKITNRRNSSLLQARGPPEVPQPAPRRRIETPPPNVTIHSYAYRDSVQKKPLQEEPSRCPRYSVPDQQDEPMNEEDPFPLSDLSCNFDLQDLNDLEPPRTNRSSDTISDNLSKILSISNEVQDTYQNIQDLNHDVEESQQRKQGKYLNYSKFDITGPTLSPNMKQIFENQQDQNRFFTQLE